MLVLAPHRLWLALALLTATACSNTRTIAREARDGGGDATADDDDADGADDPDGDDADGPDGGGPDGDDPDGDDPDGDEALDAGGDAATPDELARCEGATYTTAPSGAACNLKWFVYNGPTGPSCYAPKVGMHCDSLSIWMAWEATPPQGFDECVDPELGFHKCVYTLGEGGNYAGALTDAALEAVCKATLEVADTYVICRVLGP